MTKRVVLLNVLESRKRAATLRRTGYAVVNRQITLADLQETKRRPPDVVIIDLSKSFSKGRDAALWLRNAKATRQVLLVLVNVPAEKSTQVKRQIPDAVCTTWGRIRSAVSGAIANPSTTTVKPASLLAGYSGTPLPKKLGIKKNTEVGLVGAPLGFEKTLGRLPEGAKLKRRARGGAQLMIWFVKSGKELAGRVERMTAIVGDGGLWIAWPKKASGMVTDVTQNDVRRAGLSNGLVDFKICSIDDTWSGLRFVRRKN